MIRSQTCLPVGMVPLHQIPVVVLLSYLIGSIPFSLIFAKVFTGTDPRHGGSGNVGATNVLVITGKKRAAILAVLFDLTKGFSAVILAKILFGADIYAYLAGFFAIVGHDFPIYLNFKGGKGVATTAGAIIALNPFAIWLCLLAYAISIALTRYLILSTLITLAFVPLIFFFLGDGFPGFVFGTIVFFLALFVHKADIERLISGKEQKISSAVSSMI